VIGAPRLKQLVIGNMKGIIMANDNDMKMHEGTYESVIGMLKWGTIACALVGAIVVFIIAT
jgi:Bacterial aa3 type cytochrome c oxidase subunit IV